ncbi:hypothetical protein PR048_030512 [Dryococelus australis]|uniref:Uncharacterized protein n=1 Tax=Dryococelus australis TaxID=614101 RepID=A0ABQ9G991_9NEOP|nr:hypothetical protein PR048_030512 [Dryococelus australis]
MKTSEIGRKNGEFPRWRSAPGRSTIHEPQPLSRSEGAIRATLKSTPSASSLLRARRACSVSVVTLYRANYICNSGTLLHAMNDHGLNYARMFVPFLLPLKKNCALFDCKQAAVRHVGRVMPESHDPRQARHDGPDTTLKTQQPMKCKIELTLQMSGRGCGFCRAVLCLSGLCEVASYKWRAFDSFTELHRVAGSRSQITATLLRNEIADMQWQNAHGARCRSLLAGQAKLISNCLYETRDVQLVNVDKDPYPVIALVMFVAFPSLSLGNWATRYGTTFTPLLPALLSACDSMYPLNYVQSRLATLVGFVVECRVFKCSMRGAIFARVRCIYPPATTEVFRARTQAPADMNFANRRSRERSIADVVFTLHMANNFPLTPKFAVIFSRTVHLRHNKEMTMAEGSEMFYCRVIINNSDINEYVVQDGKPISSHERTRAGKREIPEKTRRLTASSGTIPTCESPVTREGIEPGSPWREASVLTAQPPWPPHITPPIFLISLWTLPPARLTIHNSCEVRVPHDEAFLGAALTRWLASTEGRPSSRGDKHPAGFIAAGEVSRCPRRLISRRFIKINVRTQLPELLGRARATPASATRCYQPRRSTSAAWRGVVVDIGAPLMPGSTIIFPDLRSDLRSTQKTVAPFEFRAGLEIEMKLISNRRDWRFGISIRDQQSSNKPMTRDLSNLKLAKARGLGINRTAIQPSNSEYNKCRKQQKRIPTNEMPDSYWLHGFTDTEELGGGQLPYVYPVRYESAYVIRIHVRVIAERVLSIIALSQPSGNKPQFVLGSGPLVFLQRQAHLAMSRDSSSSFVADSRLPVLAKGGCKVYRCATQLADSRDHTGCRCFTPTKEGKLSTTIVITAHRTIVHFP